MTLEERTTLFLQNAKEIHGDRYDYTEVKYQNAKTPVRISCRVHGIFVQTPDQHLRVYNATKYTNTGGCPMCAQESRNTSKRKPIESFLADAVRVHGTAYDYNKVVYTNVDTKIEIVCPSHGSFFMRPRDHLVGKQGCKHCSYRKNFSGVALRWLADIENHLGRTLQKVTTGGEYVIPGTPFKADGFDPVTNTVYEFYGDRFHGNLNIFTPDEHCHPFDKRVTAGDLFEKTMSRENEIRSNGYNLVAVWERDYRTGQRSSV